MVRITDHARQRIADVDKAQRDNAHALGVCVAEFEIARRKILPKDQNYLIRVGALVVEFEGHKTFFLNTIQSTRETQRKVGEDALREVGCDPSNGEYKIIDGVVLKLVSGVWLQEF